jgi:hypothetical protein
MLRKIRLAIVGPSDSVALIQEIADEYKERILATGYIYTDASEVPELIANFDAETDMWLFSGKVPYGYAMSKKNMKPKLYLPHTGTSIYRVFLQLFRQNIPINSMSFDTFSEKEIMETFADAGLPLPQIYVNDYQGVVSAGELTNYHLELWHEGKTSVAVTCFFATYKELLAQGVKAFRIWPTKSSIRTILDLVVSKADAILSKTGQIAIQHIAIDNYDDFVRDASSGYAVLKMELKMQEILLRFAEQIKGSIVMQGNGRFALYSTRGCMEDATGGFTSMPLVEEITQKLSVSASGGIGMGDTAYDANENATIALGLAKRKGKNKWMTVLDDKTVIGPMNSPILVKYSMRSDNAAILSLAKRLNISGTTLNRLLSVFIQLDGETIGAETLAKYLSMTERNARRLLHSMENHEYAVATGEEYRGAGRPRKMFRINMQKMLDM